MSLSVYRLVLCEPRETKRTRVLGRWDLHWGFESSLNSLFEDPVQGAVVRKGVVLR